MMKVSTYLAVLTVGLTVVLAADFAAADTIDITSNISNAGFETNGATEDGADRIPDWTVIDHASGNANNPENALAYEGSRVVSFWLNEYTNGNGQAIQQVFNVVPGEEHTLTYWLIQTGNADSVQMTATVWDDGGSGSTLQQNVSTFNHKTWQQYTLSFTPTTSQVLLRFKETTINTQNHDLLLDDVQMSYVPEPASAALLACGGFGVLLRRRRVA